MSFKVEDHYDMRKHLHVDHNMIFYEERFKKERFKKGLFIRSYIDTVKKKAHGMLVARGNAMLVFRHFREKCLGINSAPSSSNNFPSPQYPLVKGVRDIG